jgi:hypothetical protein
MVTEKSCKNKKESCADSDMINATVMKPWQILDLITKRVDIENAIEVSLSPELARAGVVLKEVQMGYAEIPTGLLATRQREQLAQQQIKTFVEEEKAQVQRKSLEAASALANMQTKIVASREAESIAHNNAKAAEAQGEGERRRLEHIAKGERARANALGQKAAEKLAINQQNLDAAIKIAELAANNPNMVKVSAVSVVGDGNSGDAALLGSLLGNSSISKAINDMQTVNKTKK